MFRPVVQRKNTYTFDWYCKCYEKHSYQSRYRTHAYTQTHTIAHDVSTCIDREHTCVSMCVCVCLCLPQNHTFSGDLLSNPQFHPDVTMWQKTKLCLFIYVNGQDIIRIMMVIWKHYLCCFIHSLTLIHSVYLFFSLSFCALARRGVSHNSNVNFIFTFQMWFVWSENEWDLKERADESMQKHKQTRYRI